jgi:hypothetical protein
MASISSSFPLCRRHSAIIFDRCLRTNLNYYGRATLQSVPVSTPGWQVRGRDHRVERARQKMIGYISDSPILQFIRNGNAAASSRGPTKPAKPRS